MYFFEIYIDIFEKKISICYVIFIFGIDSASFKVYRRGGDIGETDEETHSESATDALGTSEDDGSDAEDSDASDGIASASNLNITLGKKKHIFFKKKSCWKSAIF